MIVITTPTGQIGTHVTRELLARGHRLRVIARQPERLPQEVRENAEVVQGEHSDPAVMTTALAGADALFFVVPPNAAVSDVREHYRRFAQAAAAGINANDVERVVAVTTLGAGYPEEAGNLSAALEAEPVLTETGAAIRFLRMPFFMDNLLNQVTSIQNNGAIFMPNAADRELEVVATPDIAAVATTLLADETWSGQESLAVASGDDLTPTQLTEVIAEVLGTPVSYVQISTEQYAATLQQYGMSPAWAQGLADMADAQDDGINRHNRPQPADFTATSFRTWCQNVLKPAYERPAAQW